MEQENPKDISTYISPENYRKILKAIEEVGDGKLKPIFIALEEKISYDEIKIVLADRKK